MFVGQCLLVLASFAPMPVRPLCTSRLHHKQNVRSSTAPPSWVHCAGRAGCTNYVAVGSMAAADWLWQNHSVDENRDERAPCLALDLSASSRFPLFFFLLGRSPVQKEQTARLNDNGFSVNVRWLKVGWGFFNVFPVLA